VRSCRFQQLRGLRCRSAATRCWDCGFESHRGHGRLSVANAVCCQVRGFCEGLITRPEESYWLWCVIMCGLETLGMRRLWPTGGGGSVQSKTKLCALNTTPVTLCTNKMYSFIKWRLTEDGFYCRNMWERLWLWITYNVAHFTYTCWYI
jgi:hypothetical protein